MPRAAEQDSIPCIPVTEVVSQLGFSASTGERNSKHRRLCTKMCQMCESTKMCQMCECIQLNFMSECIRFPVRLRIPLFSRFGTLTRPRSSTFPARRTGSPRRFTSESCLVLFCRFRCSDGHREDNRARVGGATALHGSDRLVLELFSRSPCTLLPSYMPLAILTMDRRRSFG